jgi:CubicO group peptidase (beta-lactamase class C family)
VDEHDLSVMLDRHMRRHSVPGAAVGIVRDGSLMTACFGVASAAGGGRVTPRTRFGIGSVTKSMVATVLMRLEQAAMLSLDDPVATRVPELRDNDWARAATLRDLMANRSDIPLRAALEFGFEDRPDAGEGALSRLAARVPGGLPATSFWSYSNLAWCLLGRAIEVVTGTPWAEAMHDRLADAGLVETTFTAATPPAGRASGHRVTAAGAVPVEPIEAAAYEPAGTGAASTVTDLLRFAAVHLDDVSLAAMRTAHSELSLPGWLDAWCLGWGRFDWEGGPAWGWDGVLPGERAFLRILPDRRAAVALLTNGSTGRSAYRSLFADLMTPALGVTVTALRLDPAPHAARELARFAGVYSWPDRRVEVTATADRLQIAEGGHVSEARPIDGRTFLVDADDPDTPTVTFDAFDTDGRPQVLYDMLWGLRRAVPGSGNVVG